MTGLDHLWAGWRRAYIEAVQVSPAKSLPGSLFESILDLSDEAGYVVHRGKRCSVLLNAYPYTNGHILVLPNRALPDLTDLDTDEHTELWELVRSGVAALERAYRCDGVNVGMNLGKAAGAGVLDHVHAHVLPRWDGDTNFMTTVAETRVTPESLSVTWRKVRDAWPTD